MPSDFSDPPKWSSEELKADRLRAENVFKQKRREEGPRAFEAVSAEVRPAVAEALRVTRDLRNIDGDVLRDHDGLWQVLRYFCAPPISEEDLWTLVGRKFKSLPDDAADDAADVFRDVLDPTRLPWVAESRGPTDAERHAALVATTALLADATLRTMRRGSASKQQEKEVAAVLASAGFDEHTKGGHIMVVDEMKRRSYSRELKVAGAKCDVPVRLVDGRLLALECKVSNGPKNSWKRLIREVGGKAERWRQHFGNQLLTGAVLAGVYDLSCLENAQQMDGVFLFWQHDLTPLVKFVQGDSK